MGAKIGIFLAVETLLFMALLFGGAGTLHWTAGWVFMILFFAGALWITLLLRRRDPALLAERMRPPIQKGQPLWDKILIVPMILGWCAWMALMGMDAVRFRWSHMPLGLQVAGGLLMLLSFRITTRVFLENTFLSGVVRIQEDRGHRVISTGPYAIVRHPLYSSMFLYFLAIALLLGSWYGLAACTLLLSGLVFRTLREERELMNHLEGYPEYANRVRYRLIPRVW